MVKWVTRQRPQVDRIACPWLIQRFVDPAAEFLYVPADQVRAVANRDGATAFDVSGAELGHRGAECSFGAIVRTHELASANPSPCRRPRALARERITAGHLKGRPSHERRCRAARTGRAAPRRLARLDGVLSQTRDHRIWRTCRPGRLYAPRPGRASAFGYRRDLSPGARTRADDARPTRRPVRDRAGLFRARPARCDA